MAIGVCVVALAVLASAQAPSAPPLGQNVRR